MSICTNHDRLDGTRPNRDSHACRYVRIGVEVHMMTRRLAGRPELRLEDPIGRHGGMIFVEGGMYRFGGFLGRQRMSYQRLGVP